MDGDDYDGFQNSSQNVPHDDEDDDEEVMFLNLSTTRPPANGCAVLPTTSATNSSPSFTPEVIFCLLHTTLACGESASMNRGSYLGGPFILWDEGTGTRMVNSSVCKCVCVLITTFLSFIVLSLFYFKSVSC